MPFVKLDCGILNSTLWFERECREVFITALLMAEPLELASAKPQIEIKSLAFTGWEVPPGWYGFVAAASVGIIHRARVPEDLGLLALERLGAPEQSSRSHEFDGRRLIRIDGGFIVLNYMKYRERDYTMAERARRYRERKLTQSRKRPSRRDVTASHRDITQAEAEAEAEAKADLNQIQLANKQQGEPAATADSDPKPERPMFTGQRLVVFPWMEEKITRLLGPNIERFDLLDWLMRLDSKIAKSSELIPQRDGGAWLLAQATAEAERLGFSIARTAKPKRNGGLSSGANCTHSPRCDTFALCRDRILRETRDS